MLSKVAERLYWMARFIERAENTARLAKVYSHLMLDLPNGVGSGWPQLVDITGNHDWFARRYRSAGELNVMRFLLADRDNAGSLISSLAMARENMRTTRDLVPSEGWEHINELYLFAKKKLSAKTLPKDRHEFLSEVIMRCQQITGLLAGTMSHGAAYQFVRMGRNLERADMTTRIMDVGSTTLVAPGAELPRLQNRLWTYVLRAVSGHQMYRQYMRRQVQREKVLNFLLRDHQFPRAIAHTLDVLQNCVELLPRHEEPLRSALRLQRLVAEVDMEKLDAASLHHYIDDLQFELGNLHQLISSTWFSPVLADTSQAQAG